MTPYQLPEYSRFIDAIRATPDDDLPRTILADWLEERGEAERAEFIRVQCEIAQLEAASGGRLPVKVMEVGRNGVERITDLGTASDRLFHVFHRSRTIDFPIGSIVDIRLTTTTADWIVESIRPTITAVEYGLRKWEQPPCPTRDRWRALKAREGELWSIVATHEGHTCEWDGINIVLGLENVRRGFLESLRIRGADWIEHATEILRVNPVRRVCLVVPGNPVPVYGGGFVAGMGELRTDNTYGFSATETFSRTESGYTHTKWPGIAFTFEREAEAPRSFSISQLVNPATDATEEERRITENFVRTLRSIGSIPITTTLPRGVGAQTADYSSGEWE